MQRFSANRPSVFGLVLAIMVFAVAGCSNEGGFDPKAASQGDGPQLQQANKSMEDFMKTQGKAKSK